ncbi:LacI family DNA-binding transcriptional regulator [Streptomyces hoynatensis]|uniref:LacI family transcriptional regulator n=1 Tax=Streptomyces hoynatensis TaxID=1141874 RepID=A0A3A9YVB5_9ACTN|nr:LacI family DNA-binding transcriptional regulator [Streptomyces hoynatensis]RKN39709.1 LacI family transcriptional regulator [Streptomyces hoynatensis]
MQDVARAAGVSPMTVSNVVNNRPHVRESTRAKVLEAMDRLGYRVNVAARNLRAGRTQTLGLAVPEVDRPYFAELAARIIRHARAAGYRVAIEQTGANREDELEAIAWSRNSLYDGLILSAVALGQADRDLLRVDFPVVILGERIFEGPVDHVAMPNADGTRAATAHLIAHGCRRIALLTGPDLAEANVSSLRHEGYLRALREAGLPHRDGLVLRLPALDPEHGARGARRLAERGAGVDGLVAVTDSVALGAVRGLADAGLRVPEDVRVIGFDNILAGAYALPSLSTIDPDNEGMAARAVELLVRRIRGDATLGPPRDFTGPFRLVERESTAGRRPPRRTKRTAAPGR